MSRFIVGLTGGIGSGKTTVANMFAKRGICLVDADIIAREVVAPNSPGLAAISQHFGQEVIHTDGELDRATLRQIIFDQPQQRQWLNNLLHPMIRAQMLSQSDNSSSAYVIWVVPLLFENGLDSLVNRTLMIDISPEQQIARTVARDNVDAQQVQNIINSQMPRQDKLAKADDVINNQQDLQGLAASVEALHQQYLQLSGNA
ncbi:dephospho-CoA kinase [Shewanella sp. NIFS-20-20]|uniref:dephospho-CoA kinase n=1 Tax=Shewanella sp. NIFS-20-20 TaxID=2853806 RepID=UPI001C44D552|nr:dephospho-CoA kinase [Shewanella sp. NIFS-20-20]MBV7316460.1 dephospho-CoA kinase [Shewanella sp. NIFS-20-20]